MVGATIPTASGSAIPASQCEPLPVPSASATPSAAASGPQICVAVQASQTNVTSGRAAAWNVHVWAVGGAVPSVSVVLGTTPSGLTPTFTNGCAKGDGASSCDLGDLGTDVTPVSYTLQALVTVPASTASGALTLTAEANAATSPALAVLPTAGQQITVTHPAASPPPKRSTAPAPKTSPPKTSAAPKKPGTTAPATSPTLPVGVGNTIPVIAPPIPTENITSTVPATGAGNILPVLTPTGTSALSSPAADTSSTNVSPDVGTIPTVQAAALPGSTSAAPGSFTLTLNMSADTAKAFGLIILALAIILIVTRAIAGHGRRPAPAAAGTSPSRRRSRFSRRGGRATSHTDQKPTVVLGSLEPPSNAS